MNRNRTFPDSPAFFVGVLASVTFACSALIPSPGATATPTGQIGAVELSTPGAPPSTDAQHWTGTIETTTNGDYGAAGTCTGEKWKSSLDFFVAADGTLNGSGVSNVVAGAKCAGPGAKDLRTTATTGGFQVTGTFDGKVFHLEFMETSFDGSTPGLFNYALLLHGKLEVPMTDNGSAGGVIDVSVPSDGGVATANAEHTVDLTCQNCK